MIDYERDDRGPYGHGQIVHVDKDSRNVMVRFFLPPETRSPKFILVYGSEVLWDARPDPSACFHAEISYVDLNYQEENATVDQLITTQYYEFDDLRWSSHVGGQGAWITRRFT